MPKKDATLRKLILLVSLFLLAFIAVGGASLFFSILEDRLDLKIEDQNAKINIGKHIVDSIKNIEASFYQIAVIDNKRSRDFLNDTIGEEIGKINKALDVITYGGVFDVAVNINVSGEKRLFRESYYVNQEQSDKFSLEVIELQPKLKDIANLSKNLAQYKDLYDESAAFEEKNRISDEIEMLLKNAPAHFTRMIENSNRLFYESRNNLKYLQEEITEQKRYYYTLEIAIILSILIAVVLLSTKLMADISQINKTLEQTVKDEVRKGTMKDKLLMEQSRIASMGELISNISHHWRQPLNNAALLSYSIIDICDEINGYESEKEEVKKSITKINKEISTLSNIITDFSKYYNADDIKSEFQISHGIKDALKMLESRIKKQNVSVSMVIEDELCLHGSYSDFVNSIISIISNSLDIFTARGTSKPRIEIKAIRNEDLVAVEIMDNGGGIQEEIADINKIFDPYFTTKFKSFGTGLGLYFVKENLKNKYGALVEASSSTEGLKISLTFISKIS